MWVRVKGYLTNRVIQLTEFRLKGWNRHVLGFCRENHPGGGGSEGKKEGYIGALVLGLFC